MRWRYLLMALTLTAAAAVVAPIDGAVRGRLQVAPNHRYLQFTDGTPFFSLCTGRPASTSSSHATTRGSTGASSAGATRVIICLGGDQNATTPEERTIVDAMTAGLEEGDGGTHLMTFHPRGPGQSSLQLQDAAWLDFHMTQSSHGARDHDTGLYAERDLSLTPLRPTLDGEPPYESIPVGFYNRDYNRLGSGTTRDTGWRTSSHTTDNQGYQTYTPPTSRRGRDWVLILEDAAA